MDEREITVEKEVFRVRERRQPGGALSYDFSWLNGPAEGTYGFTSSVGEERLVDEARTFVEQFYAPGGIGDEDFPDHVAARLRTGGS